MRKADEPPAFAPHSHHTSFTPTSPAGHHAPSNAPPNSPDGCQSSARATLQAAQAKPTPRHRGGLQHHWGPTHGPLRTRTTRRWHQLWPTHRPLHCRQQVHSATCHNQPTQRAEYAATTRMRSHWHQNAQQSGTDTTRTLTDRDPLACPSHTSRHLAGEPQASSTRPRNGQAAQLATQWSRT